MPDGRLPATTERVLADGRVNRFPGRADVEAALPGLRTDDGFDAALVGEALFGWVRAGQTGCVFAQLLAGDPPAAGWRSIVVPEPLDDGVLAEVLAAPVLAGAEAAQVAFPWVGTAEELADLVAQIARLPEWHGVEIPGGADPDQVRVGLRWRLPEPDHVSWVLGFAPFEFMPFTRRGPFVALELRTAAVYQAARRRVEGHDEVHLADLDAPVGPDRFARMWARTVERKRSLLAGELEDAAKARVTFSLPRRLAADLPFLAAP